MPKNIQAVDRGMWLVPQPNGGVAFVCEHCTDVFAATTVSRGGLNKISLSMIVTAINLHAEDCPRIAKPAAHTPN